MPLLTVSILSHPRVYLCWQYPFAHAKLAPLLRHGDIARAKRVLDVGCGPGTNTRFFEHADYLGIDIESAYIDYARAKFGREFLVHDVREYIPDQGKKYDFILANSLFHHIDDDNTLSILRHLCGLLTDDGSIHIIDLVLPARRSIARWLAKRDRGEYPRPLEQWQAMFSSVFATQAFVPFSVRKCGISLWDLVYFKGSRPANP